MKMFAFPRTTIVERIVSKERFYAGEVSNVKRFFIDSVERIIWKNKISPQTLGITSRTYLEMQVFEIVLKEYVDNFSTFARLMESKVPYPILFIVRYGSEAKALISFKEVTPRIVVYETFETKWFPHEDLRFELRGGSVDKIYENCIYQVAPEFNCCDEIWENLKIHKMKIGLLSKIEKLNRKIRREPSLAVKQKIARTRNEIEQELRALPPAKSGFPSF